MNINNKEWLNFALELYERTKSLGLQEAWSKNDLDWLMGAAGKAAFTGFSPQSGGEQNVYGEAGMSGAGQTVENAFWQQDSGPSGAGPFASAAPKGGYAPPISIYETAREVNIHVILPGVTSREHLTLLLSPEALELSGARETGGFSGRSKTNESFYRTVRFPAPVEPSGASATYRNGFLYIRAPKKTSPAPYKLEVIFE